jgi:hypothetical protein
MTTAVQERPLAQRLLKFRLLCGQHIGPNPELLSRGFSREEIMRMTLKEAQALGVPAPETKYDEVGLIIVDTIDLTPYNGKAGDARKYERIVDDVPVYDPYHWDREKETLDQFYERMGALTAPQQGLQPVQVAATQPSPKSTPETTLPPQNPNQVNKLDELNAMNVVQLTKYAEEEEIDLKGVKSDKASIIKAILASEAAKKK